MCAPCAQRTFLSLLSLLRNRPPHPLFFPFSRLKLKEGFFFYQFSARNEVQFLFIPAPIQRRKKERRIVILEFIELEKKDCWKFGFEFRVWLRFPSLYDDRIFGTKAVILKKTEAREGIDSKGGRWKVSVVEGRLWSDARTSS